MRGDLELVDRILHAELTKGEVRGLSGKTPIIIAIEHEKHEIITRLIQSEVRLNSKEST